MMNIILRGFRTVSKDLQVVVSARLHPSPLATLRLLAEEGKGSGYLLLL